MSLFDFFEASTRKNICPRCARMFLGKSFTGRNMNGATLQKMARWMGRSYRNLQFSVKENKFALPMFCIVSKFYATALHRTVFVFLFKFWDRRIKRFLEAVITSQWSCFSRKMQTPLVEVQWLSKRREIPKQRERPEVGVVEKKPQWAAISLGTDVDAPWGEKI